MNGRSTTVQNHWFWLTFFLLLFSMVAGCASQGLRPGTGDLSFRLVWQGEADLDLHVLDPLDRHIGIVVPSASGTPEERIAAIKARIEDARDLEKMKGSEGVLDVDCNGSADRICSRPIENIFWPTGTAERGTYTFWVHLFQPRLGTEPIAYTVEIRRGSRVISRIPGAVSNELRTAARRTHTH